MEEISSTSGSTSGTGEQSVTAAPPPTDPVILSAPKAAPSLTLTEDEMKIITERRRIEARNAVIKDSPACTCNAAGVPHYHGEEGINNA